MISKVLLLSAMSFLGIGMFHRQRVKILEDEFDRFKNIPEFNIDYMRGIQDLPTNKDILVLGKVKAHQQKYESEDKKECVLRSYVADNAQQDLLWQTKQKYGFFVINDKEESIYVENGETPTWTYNLRVSGSKPKKQLDLPWTMKIKNVFKSTLQQRIVEVDKNILAVGRLYRSPNGTHKLVTTHILADNKASFLKHVDSLLVRHGSRYSIFSGIGIALMAIHYIYTRKILSKTQIALPE